MARRTTGTVTGMAVAMMVSLGAAASANAAVRRVPGVYRTIQAAVDAANPGDVIDVGPGSHCGARIDRPVILRGHGRATIVGCPDGPALGNGIRAGFFLPGSAGVSGASGTRISGFVFDGSGVSSENLEPLGLGVIGGFAHDVRVERNVILGTIQGITNTGGDRWVIAHNRIQGLTVFDCTGALCGGGDGIVVQVARDAGAAPGGPEAPENRPEGNVVFANEVEGTIPDGFGVFAMVGVFVLSADRTAITHNRLTIPDNPAAESIGQGVLVSNVCCGQPALNPGARQTVVAFNDGRGSEIGVEIDGTGGANTLGLVLFANAGVEVVEGTVVDDRVRPRRPLVAGRWRNHRPLF